MICEKNFAKILRKNVKILGKRNAKNLATEFNNFGS